MIERGGKVGGPQSQERQGAKPFFLSYGRM